MYKNMSKKTVALLMSLLLTLSLAVLPARAVSQEEIDALREYRDQVTALITEKCLLPAGSRVLLADDWMSTAATVQACSNMIEDVGCKVAGIATVGVNYRSAAKDMIDAGNVRYVYCEE